MSIPPQWWQEASWEHEWSQFTAEVPRRRYGVTTLHVNGDGHRMLTRAEFRRRVILPVLAILAILVALFAAFV